MGRPFVEFLQSQWLDWRVGELPGTRASLSVKLLSRDETDGSCSLLLRYPPGWRAPPEPLRADEECFVLQGELRRGDADQQPHDYSYLPAGHAAEIVVGDRGAVVLTFFSQAPSPVAEDDAPPAAPGSSSGAIARLRTSELPWDRSNMDPNIAHLNAYRKNLRLDPAGGCRTYLLAGLPQGYPASGTEPLERHPHVEEMFMIAGDMPCSRGIMQAGAYFWRPPYIWHGADCTLTGFLCLMRTPGTNRTVSEWGDEHTVRWDPPFDPVLTPELASRARAPAAHAIEY